MVNDSIVSRQTSIAPPPLYAAPPGWLEEGSTANRSFADGTTHMVGAKRSQSAHGSISSNSTNNADICRICHCEGSGEFPLIMPCYCSGSLMYVHQKCLQQWIKSSQTRSCEVCRYNFKMHSKLKPFRKWEKLNISSVERRKILCSITFHVIAITCVVWALYVLIERTADEIANKELAWLFYMKLVVVAIGFIGGLVFMYVQCKMYVQLFRRWKAYNKVIYVQNCPEKGNKTTTTATRTATVAATGGGRLTMDTNAEMGDGPTILLATSVVPTVTTETKTDIRPVSGTIGGNNGGSSSRSPTIVVPICSTNQPISSASYNTSPLTMTAIGPATEPAPPTSQPTVYHQQTS